MKRGRNELNGFVCRTFVVIKRGFEVIKHEVVKPIIEHLLIEHGPLTINELNALAKGIGNKRIWKLLNRDQETFKIVGQLLLPGVPPQFIYGLSHVVQPLVSEPKKAHPFDLPKHTIFYRDLMKQRRIKYERY